MEAVAHESEMTQSLNAALVLLLSAIDYSS
jgi:hypothetical protein